MVYFAVRVSFTGTVRVTPPAVALRVTLTAEVPPAVDRANVKVLLPFPGALTFCGLNTALTPTGRPETENATGELNPPSALVVRATVAFFPGAMAAEAEEAASVKPAMFSVSAAFWMSPPPVPVGMSV